MPDNQGSSTVQIPDIYNDPGFHALPLAEKHKAMMAEDPDYRGLPPSEQAKMLDDIHYSPQYGPKNEKVAGEGNRLADTIQTQAEGGARKLLSNFGLPQSISDITSGEYGRRITKPGRLSDIIEPYKEAGKKSKVGYVPLIGPSSVAASEDLRQGKYGEMGADLATGVAQIAPAAEGISRGAGAVGDAASSALRRPSGELRTGTRLVSQIGGAAAGHEMLPYAGGYLGYKLGPSLAEEMVPGRPAPKLTPFRETEDNPWVPLKDRIGAEAGTEGVGSEDIMRIPEPRGAPTTPNLINSIPREELPGLAKQGRQGAGEQLRATGKTVVYTPESGYAPPKSKSTLREIMSKGEEGKRLTGGQRGDKLVTEMDTKSLPAGDTGPKVADHQAHGRSWEIYKGADDRYWYTTKGGRLWSRPAKSVEDAKSAINSLDRWGAAKLTR